MVWARRIRLADAHTVTNISTKSTNIGLHCLYLLVVCYGHRSLLVLLMLLLLLLLLLRDTVMTSPVGCLSQNADRQG